MPNQRLAAGAFVLSLLASSTVQAQSSPPQLVKVKGFLTDESGGKPDGTVSMIFDLYEAAAGGTPLTSSGVQAVEVKNGVYEVSLLMPESALGGADRFIEIIVAGEVLSPRVPLTRTSFGYMARHVGGSVSADVERPQEPRQEPMLVESGVLTLPGPDTEGTLGVFDVAEFGQLAVQIDCLGAPSRVFVEVRWRTSPEMPFVPALECPGSSWSPVGGANAACIGSESSALRVIPVVGTQVEVTYKTGSGEGGRTFQMSLYFTP